MNKRGNLTIVAFMSMLSSSSIMFVGLLTGVITARALGAEGRGVIAMVMTWTGLILALTQLPIAEAIVVSRGEKSAARILAASLTLSLFVAFAVSVPSIWLLLVYFSDVPRVPVGAAIGYAVVMLFAGATTVCFRGYFQRRGEFTKVFFYSNFQPVIYLLFLAVLFALSIGEVAYFLNALTASIIVTCLLRVIQERRNLALCFESNSILSLAKSSLVLHGPKVAQYLSEQGDRLLVVWLLPADQIGIFFVAATFSSIFAGLFNTAIRLIALPVLSSSDIASRTLRAIHILSMTVAGTGLGFIITASTANLLLPLLFGPEFTESVFLSILLAATAAFTSIRVSLLEVQKSYSVSISLLYSSLLFVGTSATVALALFPYIGVLAIVAARAVGELAAVVVLSRQLHRINPSLSIKDWLVPDTRILRIISSQIISKIREYTIRWSKH